MKAEKYLVLSPTGELRWEEIYRYELLDRMYQIIGCDCVEQVRSVIDGICFVIDESGKIKNPPQFHNELASRLYYGYLIGMDDIVGPAVFCSLKPVGPYNELDWAPLDALHLVKLSLYLGIPIPEQ